MRPLAPPCPHLLRCNYHIKSPAPSPLPKKSFNNFFQIFQARGSNAPTGSTLPSPPASPCLACCTCPFSTKPLYIQGKLINIFKEHTTKGLLSGLLHSSPRYQTSSYSRIFDKLKASSFHTSSYSIQLLH